MAALPLCPRARRQECSEGAEVARQESLSLLRGEVAQLKVRCWLARASERFRCLPLPLAWLPDLGACASLDAARDRQPAAASPLRLQPPLASTRSAWQWRRPSKRLRCAALRSSTPNANLQIVQSQLHELQALHAEETAALQDAGGKQLSAHVKTADKIIRELEATATALQVGAGAAWCIFCCAAVRCTC